MSGVSEPQLMGLWRISTLANPSTFMRLSGKLLPWLAGITVVLFVAGLTMAFRAPPDYQQGETVRIMFIHVPSAWLSMACYTLIAISSAGYLIWRHPLADVSAKAAAPIGATFTLLALITGSLWGKPMWGAYWVWDARLTSVLILFFLYLGLIALRQAIDDPGRAGRAAAILSLIGAINIPIIKFSELVEHAAPARKRDPRRWADDTPGLAHSAVCHGHRFHRALHHPSHEGNARRDFAAALRGDDRHPCARRRGGIQCLISGRTRASSGYRMEPPRF